MSGLSADIQHAVDECRLEAARRREIWQVVCDHGRFIAEPRRFDVSEDTVVGTAGSDGEFFVSPEWQEKALAEGWR